MQPIVGTMLGVARPGAPDGSAPVLDWLALYAQDEAGYDNLCALVSAAHLDRPVEEPAHVRLDALEGRTDGLIALTAGGGGRAGPAARRGAGRRAAADILERLKALFPGRLYIELSRRGDPVEQRAEAAADRARLCARPAAGRDQPGLLMPRPISTAPTTRCCASPSRARSTATTASAPPPEAWLKPAAEMRRLFADLPEAIENTRRHRPPLRVRRAQAQADPAAASPAIPRPRPSSFAATPAPGSRRGSPLYDGPRARRSARPISTGSTSRSTSSSGWAFPAYFLIVADFIKWAKENDIPVGPGRGSGAGSVVAWALTITDLDPIRLGLLFERFLNPERVSMPDFDIDFCETRRGEVIRYVQQRYGADKVAQIITFGKLKARAVLKDTGRVLQMPYGQVDRLAKLIPNHPTDPWTLERALNGVTELAAEYKNDAAGPPAVRPGDEARGPAAPRLDPRRRRGDRRPAARPARPALPRSALGHAGHPVRHEICRGGGAGEVRLPRPQDAVGAAEGGRRCWRKRGIEVDLDRLAWDDPEVYKLLQRGDTVGVFQLESEGMRRTLAAVKPTSFERHHRARLALPAGPDGQYPDVRRPQERPRADRISASPARGRC